MKSFIKTVLGGALAAVGLVQVAVFSTAMLAGTAMAQNSPPTLNATKEVVRSLTGTLLHPFGDQRTGPADTARFQVAQGIATAPDGRIFVTDFFNGGRVAVLNAAGNNVSTYRALGSPPHGIARAPDGRLFVALSNANRIVVISSDSNTVSTYAGSSAGAAGYADGSTVTARFSSPRGLTLAADGRLFVADNGNHRIRVISADGATVSTYAGNGVDTVVNGSTATASFGFLADIAWVPDGRLFVESPDADVVRVIDANGSTVSTYAGGGTAPAGFTEVPIEQARFIAVEGMTALADGRVFVLGTNGTNARLIYEINAAGSAVTLYAGDVDSSNQGPIFPIDGDALETQFRPFNTAQAAVNGTDLLVATDIGVLRAIESVAAPVDLSASLTTFSQQRANAVVFDSATIQGVFTDADADVLSYSISSTPSADLFTISASSGLIRMARTPADDEASTYTLIIAASDSSASVATTATVVLSPFNHPPVVTLATTTISVAEDFNPFSVGLIAASNDGDNDGTTQTISYSIDPAEVAFATVSIAAQSGTLTLSAIADAFGTTTLTVTAADSGTENTQSTTEVLLVVRAVNDAPQTLITTMVLAVGESQQSTGAVIVDATMMRTVLFDVDNNSSYRIDSGNLSALFAIDPLTGALSWARVPTPAEEGSYSLVVAADDGAAVATTTIVINVDVNQPPSFSLSTTTIRVNQGFSTQTIALLNVDDGDDSVIQSLSYRLSTTTLPFAQLSISSATGQISISGGAGSFGGPITISVGVEDSSARNSIAFSSFSLLVNSPPQVVTSASSVAIAELAQQVGSLVSGVSALFSDADSVLSYAIISGNAAALFAIDANSGAITLAAVPADAQSGLHTLQIEASDGLAVATATLHITLAAINNPPIFALSTTTLHLLEDFGSTQVVVVSSDDGDSDVSQTLTYRIETTSTSFASLSIDAQSGTLTLNSSTDVFGVATIYVVADDSSANNGITTQVLTVTIVSVNDAPQVLVSSTTLYVAEAQQVAATVLSTVVSLFSDIDSTLSYTISSGNAAAVFALDSSNGVLSLAALPTDSQAGTYTLHIAADDGIADAVMTTLTVVLAAINNPPTFSLSATELVLDEDFSSPQIVVVTASDDGDADSSQALSYTVSLSGDVVATLAIDPQSGTVTITSIADAFGTATIVVTADDGSTHNRSSTRVITLRVNPVAGDAPVFRHILQATVGTYATGFVDPSDVALSTDGRLFVSDRHRIVEVSSDGALATYAGSTFDPDYTDGAALNARFAEPKGLALLPDGRLLVADRANHRVRVISADGATVSTYAGNGSFVNQLGYINQAPRFRTLGDIRSIALAPDGRVFVADEENGLIIEIDASATNTVAYAGVTRVLGFRDGVNTQALFNRPRGMVVHPDGRLFVADISSNRRIRVISAEGTTVSTYVGSGDSGYLDGSSATARFDYNSVLFVSNSINDMVVHPDGRLFIADFANHVIRVVSADGSTVSTHAGIGGTAGLVNGPALSARFNRPEGLALSADGSRLFVADRVNDRIRVIDESVLHTIPFVLEDVEQVVGAPLHSAAQVQAVLVDPDGDATYSIIGGNEAALFSIDPASGALSLAAVPTDAQAGDHQVLVQADDGANAATVTLTVTLEVINDPPTFSLSESALTLTEDFGSAQVIVVSSDDGDATVVQPLSYDISTTSIGFANLVIDADSGTLTLSSVLNQFGSTVTVTITVDDGQNTNNLATQTLLVAALDVNTPPIFTLNITNTLSLSEDFGDISVIVSSSNDGDEDGIETPLTFSVSTTDVGFATLSIDSQSGAVTIVALTNRFGVATVGVAADDGAENGRSTQSFVLSVVSVNDPPEFNLSAATLVVDEDFGRVSVTVTDSNDGDDLATAQVLSYSISTENVGFATLSIDAQSGEVTIDSVADGFGVATVYVVADDSSAANNFSTQSFVLTVNAANDAPIFTLSTAAVVLDEDFTTTQAISVVSSDDGDDGVSQPLTYSLSTENVGFATLSINVQSGAVTIDSVVDGFGVATVVVTLADDGVVDNFSTQSFVLTVNNINDAPNFALSTTALVVDEDFGSARITIASSDSGDDGIAQTLTYSISTENVGFALLSIDQPTVGEIIILSTPDTFGTATIYVVADDGGAVDSRSTQSFVLTVNAVNDAPSFALSTTAVVLDEDFATTQAISVVSSDDGDIDGVTQTLSYSLSTSHVGFAMLSVDDSGTVSISSVANGFGVATVTVTLTDDGVVDIFSTQSFVLTVNNINDAPNFALSTTALVVDEDFTTTQTITVASSDDGDGMSQSLNYSLSTSHVGFAMLSVDGSGTVSISSVADAFGTATIYVVADDGGEVDSRSTQSFVLTVNAVNDAPSFTLSTAAVVLDEDFTTTQTISVVSSDDGDIDGVTQTLSYSLSTENVGFATLLIDDDSGTVSISSVEDGFGVATVYVVADDSGAVDSRSTQSFTLTVNSVNDAPNFALSTAALSLAEDFGSTQVTVISSDDGDGTTQPLSYSVSTTAVSFATLSISTQSGTITIASVANGFGVATVTVTVNDSSAVNALSTQVLAIVVNAVNDAPVFTLSTSNLTLDENFATVTVTITDANDGDVDGVTQALIYSLNTSVTDFARLSISSQTGEITISSILNQSGGATVYVTADDGGSVNSSATRALALSVGAVNGAPNFTLSTTALTLDEDFATTQVTVVSSNDGDGTTQVLTYSVSSTDTGFALLTIDADSGTLTITSVADAFGAATITVTVDDGADFNSEFTQAVRVVVNAVNEVPSFVLSATALSLAEDFGSTQVTVTSSDDGDAFIAQILTYSLSTTDVGFATLSIDSNSGEITFTGVDNAFGVATVTVTVDDSSATANTAVQTVVVTVQSVNDAPIFTLSTTAVVLDEDFATTEAITVASSDDGDGTSQPLSYSISTTDVGFATLSIDANSGALSLTSVADAFGVATVYVVVDDGGDVYSRSTQSFVLTVNSVNDAPNFSLSTAALALDEDFGIARITIASSDSGDDGIAQTLTYTISTESVGFATLSVDDSGTVSISGVADAFGVATVTVTVDDGGDVYSRSTQSFVLTVNSVNDAPNFALSTAALTLDEDFGSTQVTVVSSDDGDGTSQTLTYSLSTSHVGFATLSVDSSGTVRIDGVADAFGVATVTVTVDDSGAVDNLAMQSFVLTVNSVNDAPSFTLSTAALTLDEDFGSTQVTVISSDDGDATEDQLLSYSLSSSNVGFATLSVDGSGTVSIRSVANGFGVATVTVTVDDSGAVDNLAMQSFVLTVNSVNDAPNFTLSTSALVLDEGFGLRQVSVLSSDDGDGTNQVLTYSLSTTDTGFAELSISSQTGVITINSIANQNGGATVYVIADDGGSVNSSATQALVLAVGAVNGAPNFTLSTTDLTLDEDFGSVQVTVLSSDDGDGTNQVLTYSVSVSAAALGVATAEIDAASGALTLTSVPNAFGVVTVTVTVDDGADFDSQSEQYIRLTVNSVNDAPSFTLSTSALIVDEGFVSAQLSVVSSEDGDIGVVQSLSYSINTTDVGFATLSIDDQSGAVTLSGVAGAFGTAIITVTVDDGDAVNNRFEQTFTLTVNNINDAPTFTLSTTAISVREGFGSVEVTVASSDDGDGGIQTLRYSLSTTNVGFATLSIDADSGAITLSSVANGFGAATVTVTVDDGDSADNIATQVLSLTVVEIVDGLMAVTVGEYVGGLHTPEHVLVLSDGRLLVADSGNHVIYEVVSQGDGTGSATVYAGSEGASGNVNGGSASEARFSAPVGLALASDGRVLVADRDNNSIRVISADGSTVADYATGLDTPIGLAWATDGRLFVADSGNNRIAVISADGSAVTDYATGLNNPQGISLASDGRLFVADSGNSRVAVISADGNTVSTYAGAGEGDADGSVATALLGQPQGVVIAGRTVFVADTNNDLIRVVDVSASTVSTFAGLAGSEVVLDAPVGVGVSTDGRQVFVADQNNARIVVAQTGNALPTIVLSTANVSLLAGFADFTINVSVMDEGSPLSWQVTVEDNTVLTATNNALSITLSSVANQTGSARLTVHAMDDLGAMVYRTIEVTVEEAVEPPAPEPAAGGGGGGGGCSLHAATGASDWTLWLLLLLSLLALRLRPRYL